MASTEAAVSQDEFILSVIYILILMPVANTSVLFATEYGGDEKLAAKTVFITTVMSIVTGAAFIDDMYVVSDGKAGLPAVRQRNRQKIRRRVYQEYNRQSADRGTLRWSAAAVWFVGIDFQDEPVESFR